MQWVASPPIYLVFGEEWLEKDPMRAVSKGETIIGNSVWIGNAAIIMKDVKIGDGSIIGTNSLFTKDVDPYTIVGGTPAKKIRKSFDEGTAELLLAVKWWDWDVQKITDNLEAITSSKVDELNDFTRKANEFK